MGGPPRVLDGARVLQYALLDAAIVASGRTVHRLGQAVLGPASSLAICQYDDDPWVYLFYCDDSWAVVTDSYHESVARAMEQAEFEYRGESNAWRFPA